MTYNSDWVAALTQHFSKGSRGGTWRHVTTVIVVPSFRRIEWAVSRPDRPSRSGAIHETCASAAHFHAAITLTPVQIFATRCQPLRCPEANPDKWKPDLFNPRPARLLDFPPLAGGGGAFERPSPIISAPGRRREKKTKDGVRKLAKNHFEIISVIFCLRSKLRSPGIKIKKKSWKDFQSL